jgi:hypothetical protein
MHQVRPDSPTGSARAGIAVRSDGPAATIAAVVGSGTRRRRTPRRFYHREGWGDTGRSQVEFGPTGDRRLEWYLRIDLG